MTFLNLLETVLRGRGKGTGPTVTPNSTFTPTPTPIATRIFIISLLKPQTSRDDAN